MSKKTPLYQLYSPEMLRLGSKEYDCSESSKEIIEAYCSLSNTLNLASWEQVADKLGLPQNKSTQRQIVGALTIAAGAYRDLYNQPHPYIVREPEE